MLSPDALLSRRPSEPPLGMPLLMERRLLLKVLLGDEGEYDTGDLVEETKGILGEVGRRDRPEGKGGREESWLPVRPSVNASLAGRVMR